MIFDIFEVFIFGLIHSFAVADAFNETMNHVNVVWLGAVLVIFVSFLPFFAFKELSRFMGSDKIRDVFFKKQERTEP
jgi:hypothetical protein